MDGDLVERFGLARIRDADHRGCHRPRHRKKRGDVSHQRTIIADEPVLNGERCRFAPARHVQSREDPADVVASRGFGDEELLPDLAVRESLGYEAEHLALPRG